MGATSARKAMSILTNAENTIAIELLAAAQGLDLRSPLMPAPGTGAALAAIREASPTLEDDRPLSPDIRLTREAIISGRLLDAVEDAVGPLR